jgi:hypothetical protein
MIGEPVQWINIYGSSIHRQTTALGLAFRSQIGLSDIPRHEVVQWTPYSGNVKVKNIIHIPQSYQCACGPDVKLMVIFT